MYAVQSPVFAQRSRSKFKIESTRNVSRNRGVLDFKNCELRLTHTHAWWELRDEGRSNKRVTHVQAQDATRLSDTLRSVSGWKHSGVVPLTNPPLRNRFPRYILAGGKLCGAFLRRSKLVLAQCVTSAVCLTSYFKVSQRSTLLSPLFL